MTTITKKLFPFFFCFLLLICTNCVDQEFDAPPLATLPAITANATIQDLLSQHRIGDAADLITEELVIEGVVIANDNGGNFFKNIVIQDETGGIAIRLNTVGLYNDYPIGRQVFVSAKNLYLSDYNGLPQLGGSPEDPIEDILIAQHVFAGEKDQAIPSTLLTLEELSDLDITRQYINRLVTIENVQFATSALSKTYGDIDNRWSVNLDVEDCEGNSIILRSSGYADFAGETPPNDKGNITAVVSIFRTTPQLLIRQVRDINFQTERCGRNTNTTTTTPPSTTDERVGFTSFDGLEDGATVTLAGWRNVASKGERLWQVKEFGGNVYAQATAYLDASEEMEAWLVTPAIDLSAVKSFSFESAKAFQNHDGLTVWIATDFDGENIATANWTALDARIASATDEDHAWIPSGTIDLSDFIGTASIGFKYIGNNNDKTSSFRVDNIAFGE